MADVAHNCVYCLLPGFYRVQFGAQFLHFVRLKVPFRRCKVPEYMGKLLLYKVFFIFRRIIANNR